jgi:hypothetical protein
MNIDVYSCVWVSVLWDCCNFGACAVPFVVCAVVTVTLEVFVDVVLLLGRHIGVVIFMLFGIVAMITVNPCVLNDFIV